MNIGVAFGRGLNHIAVAAGAKSDWAMKAIWFALLAAGVILHAPLLVCVSSSQESLWQHVRR